MAEFLREHREKQVAASNHSSAKLTFGEALAIHLQREAIAGLVHLHRAEAYGREPDDAAPAAAGVLVVDLDVGVIQRRVAMRMRPPQRGGLDAQPRTGPVRVASQRELSGGALPAAFDDQACAE